MQPNQGQALGAYWQGESSFDDSAIKMEHGTYIQHPVYLDRNQSTEFPLYPSVSNGFSEVYNKPLRTSPSSLVQNTSGSLPSTNERKGPRGARSTARVRTASKPSIASASHAARERRADKRQRAQKRREVSRLAGQPLSEIAAEIPHVLVCDAEEFANRPVDVRRSEAAHAGKIKRPLNAFMLYRRSYQNVAKTRCMRNNHQQVSTVCGDSWKSYEPSNIVDKFNRLAGVEKHMHELAFPNYKYDPASSKNSTDDAVVPETPDPNDENNGSRRRPIRRSLPKGGANGRSSRIKQLPQPSQKGLLEKSEDEVSIPDVPPTNVGPYWGPPFLRQTGMPLEINSLFYIDNHAYQEQLPVPMETQSNDTGFLSTSTYLEPGHGVIDPKLFLVDQCIDTALLAAPCEPKFITFPSVTPTEVHFQGGNYHLELPNTTTGAFIPGIYQGDTHNAYLKGTDEDWQVEPLEEGSQFQDWISQAEYMTNWS